VSLQNLSAYAAGQSITRDGHGRVCVVVSIKACFQWDDRGTLLSVPPEPLRVADTYAGDPASTGLSWPAEVGPPKPAVDVLLAGALVFPVAIQECDVTLQVGQRLRKTVRVYGPRYWHAAFGSDLRPTPPRPTTRVAIDWAHSFGGSDPGDPPLVELRNPVGTGVATRAESLTGRPAPSFDDPLRAITSWKDSANPVGFGPIAAHWQPRVRYAGTYDDGWRQDRSPLPPEDFDPRFFNAAPDDQQLPSYQAGEELLLVYGGQGARARFQLPVVQVPVAFVTVRAVLDTEACVDTVVVEPETNRLTVIARAAFVPLPNVLAFRETLVGTLSRGRRRALDSGRRYRDRSSSQEGR
jgi:hypothetical protein